MTSEELREELSKLPEPIRIFQQMFWGTFSRWGMIYSFKRVFNTLKDDRFTKILDEDEAYVKRFAIEEEYKDFFLVDRKTLIEQGLFDDIALKMSTKTMNESEVVSCTALLVFAHSILEVFIMEALEISAKHKPEDWEEYLGSRNIKVDFCDIKNYDSLLKVLIIKELLRLKNESINIRMNRVLAVYQPLSGKMGEFEYDNTRLKKIDEARHDIVHRRRPLQELGINQLDKEIEFIEEICKWLVLLVHKRYGLQCDLRFRPLFI